MSSFHTETIEEQLTVLFFVPSESVQQVVVNVVSQLNIVPEFVQTDSQHIHEFAQHVDPEKKWYKMYWIVDPEKDSEETVRECVKFWKNRPELTYVICHSPFDFPHVEQKISHITQNIENIIFLTEQISPYTSIFLYNFPLKSPLFSLLQYIFEDFLSSKQYFPLESFSPVFFEEVIQKSIELSFNPRGGLRKTLIGEEKVYLDGLLKTAQDSHLKVTLADPDQVISFPESSLVHISSESFQTWSSSFVRNTKIENDEEMIEEREVEDLPKPSLVFNLKHSTAKVSENVQQTMESGEVEPRIIEKKIRVISTKPIQKTTPIAIPQVEIPTITRSNLILKSLEFSVAKKTKVLQFTPPPRKEIKNEHVTTQVEEQEKEKRSEQQIEERMQNLFHTMVPEKNEQKDRREKKVKKKISKRNVKVLLGTIGFVGMILGVSTSVYLFSRFTLISQVKDSLSRIEQGSVAEQNIPTHIEKWGRFLEYQLKVFGYLDPQSADVNKVSQVAIKIGKLKELSLSYQSLQKGIEKQIFYGKEGEALSNIKKLSPTSQEYYIQLAELEGLEDTLSDNTLLHISTKDSLLTGSLSELRRKAFILHQLTEVAPIILGEKQQKQYAILVEDATELRPSGGVVSGVILLTFDKGKVIDSQSFSEKEIMDTVGGTVSAPDDYSQVFKKNDWVLSDVGWNADFGSVASQIQPFLEKISTKKIDGVIAITSKGVEELLGEDGVVYQDTTYSNKNFVDKYLSLLRRQDMEGNENVFFALTAKVLQSYLQPNSSQLSLFWEKVPQLLDRGEVLVSLSDQSAQSTIQALGWSGSILSPSCPTQLLQEDCKVFSVYQVDANINHNKANVNIQKSVEENITFSTNEILHNRIISYESVSKDVSYPFGNYKSYTRLYLPVESEFTSVKINERELSDKDISVVHLSKFTIVGFSVEVPPGEKVSVSVQYKEKPLTLPSSYAYFNQKQPGEKRSPINVTFSYHSPIVPVVVAPEAVVSAQSTEFHFFGDQHSFAGAKFRDVNTLN